MEYNASIRKGRTYRKEDRRPFWTGKTECYCSERRRVVVFSTKRGGKKKRGGMWLQSLVRNDSDGGRGGLRVNERGGNLLFQGQGRLSRKEGEMEAEVNQSERETWCSLGGFSYPQGPRKRGGQKTKIINEGQLDDNLKKGKESCKKKEVSLGPGQKLRTLLLLAIWKEKRKNNSSNLMKEKQNVG